MNPADIHQELARIASEELGWSEALPSGELSTALDSMQRLSLVVEIEDRFEICFEPDEENELQTLDDVITLIAAKLQQKREES